MLHHDKSDHSKANFLTTCLATLGVVYGDIGTSPLYAIRECFHSDHAITMNETNILGVLSCIFWALIVVITVKYLFFVMKADNRGEGGILALMSLVIPRRLRVSNLSSKILVVLGIFGATLLYGDGVITPAITVLSAVEGLSVATHLFDPYVIPIATVILLVLFYVQKFGTHKVGIVFGPVVMVWFLVLGLMGVRWILILPSVLKALNPIYAMQFFQSNGFEGLKILSSVFLVVTGGEALYADMGHFGRSSIKVTWLSLVLPCLVLTYFGQGALLLLDPSAVRNPFYLSAPPWALFPLVILATVASVVASQAVISGAFSLTYQAVALGYLPRLKILHTSSGEKGQVYVPIVNFFLAALTLFLVFEFRTSSSLAGAYGIAVSTTMVITTLLAFVVVTRLWGWSLLKGLVVSLFFLSIDLVFFGANIMKLFHGGWVPLILALGLFYIMTTWRKGRDVMSDEINKKTIGIDDFISELDLRTDIKEVEGMAVYMTSNLKRVPQSLLMNFMYNKVLHQTVVMVSVSIEDVPHLPFHERIEFKHIDKNIYTVSLRYGFKQSPNIPRDLSLLSEGSFQFDKDKAMYFLGREWVLASKDRYSGMAYWRERLFAWMMRNASRASAYFKIPSEKVIEIGSQVEI